MTKSEYFLDYEYYGNIVTSNSNSSLTDIGNNNYNSDVTNVLFVLEDL